MNKIIIIVIGVAVIVGAIFALRSLYNSPVETMPTSTSSSVLDRIEAAIRAKLKK